MNNPGYYAWTPPDLSWWEAICGNNPRSILWDVEIDRHNPEGPPPFYSP